MALNGFQSKYKNSKITKQEIFYYIYSVLNSKEYQERFKNALTKDFPYIPFASDVNIFKLFSKKGKDLAELHLNYENQNIFNGVKIYKNDKIISIDNLKKR